MGPRRRRTPPLLVAAAAAVLAVGLLVMLWPVLTNPIVADDRYWYPDAAGLTDGSYTGVVTHHVQDMDRTVPGFGRVTVLAYILRSLSMLAVLDVAVWSATPLVAGQAVLKVALLGLIMAVLTAFLRVLRHRRPDGSLGRLPGWSIGFVVLLTATLTAAGAQAHAQARNGWTAYAVLTWGAAAVLLGTATLLLWVTRLAARHGGAATAGAVAVAFLVAVFLNTSYEMYYVAVPLILAVLAQQPLLAEEVDPGGRAGRRARLWVGGAFLLSFATLFVGIRGWIARLCAVQWCYEGSELDLGPQTLVTAVRNLLTSVPGAGRSELAADLREQGMADQLPSWVTPGSVLVGGLSALALLVLLRTLATLAGRGVPDGAVRPGAEPTAERRGQARLLLLGALVPAAAALGTALIMALSHQAAEIIGSVGTPYRNTMVTWTMLALTLAMVVAAALLVRPRSPVPAVATLVVAVLASHTVAANYPALRASHVDPGNQAVAAVHWEIVLGDPTPEADARRCATLDRAEDELGGLVEERLLAAAETTFRHYHGGVYCSEPRPSGEDN